MDSKEKPKTRTVYMVIEADRGFGIIGRRAFWSEEEADAFAATSAYFEVVEAEIEPPEPEERVCH